MLDQRKKVFVAVAGSIGIHASLLLLWALSVQWLPREQAPIPEPEKEPIKVTIEDVPTPATPPPVVVQTPPPVHFLDTSDMAGAATPPPDAKVQSAKNTADTSELPAASDRAGMTQRGRKVPVFALNTREFRPPDPASVPEPASITPLPPVQTAPPLPRAVAQTVPKPPVAAVPAATPLIQRGDFALAEPASLPTEPARTVLPAQPTPPVEPNPYDPAFRPPTSLTEPPRPTPLFANNQRNAYQPEKMKTAVSGNINNQGAGSLASAATPLGRYQNTVIETIRRRWYGYLGQRTDLASIGKVTVHFLVGMDGRARSTKVVTNTANEALASISLQAVLDARIPPMPAEVVPDTGGGQLPMELTFEFIDSGNF